ncbi:MAG TPA: enoyl-CoA hydratase/isomerase family protein [Oscillatoriaceae cyanobacterium]
MSETIRYEQTDGIGVLTLDRPAKLNAMTHAMGDAIRALVPKLNADPTLRCVLVQGEGRAFSAGGDLDFLIDNSRRPEHELVDDMRDFYTKFLTLRDLEMPSIALLAGRATGAGLCLALACDLRYAADDALLSVNFVRVGLSPGMAGTWALPRLVGAARAAELLFTGRTVDAQEALSLGLVNGVCPRPELLETGRQVAAQIAQGAPQAMRATKALLRGNAERDLIDGLTAEAEAQAKAFGGTELQEGIRAIREKRTPAF